MTSLKLHFLGAAGTVTGSKFLLETEQGNILIDCGMFQGLKELREINWKEFPFPPEKIDLILLTHGHLDHSGYLPRLYKQGYIGEVRGTPPSLVIAGIILMDSAKIMEEEAEKANAEGFSVHEPALPFYTQEEAQKAINYFRPIELDIWYEFSKDIRYRFILNGHILGATFIELEIGNKTFVFSGDIGRDTDDLLDSPERPRKADYLILESTYGDRLHPKEDIENIFIKAATETIEKRGILIIPSFAVERLQSIMYKLWKLSESGKLPKIPIYIDSPMGSHILETFMRFPNWHKISSEEFKQMMRRFRITTSYRDTWKTLEDKTPKIVIAGSGMVTGGRVLTYLRYYLEKPNTQVMLAGFQAEGTRGRQLIEGSREIKIFGKYCEVNAEIIHLQSLSAHADQAELISWISQIQPQPEKVFLVHGEPASADSLRLKIKDTYHWPIEIPKLNEVFELSL